MKKLFCTLVFLGVISGSFAQLNSYKYIIVPKKFDIFPAQNHYQTTTLLRYLFEEQGFNVVLDDELPPDLVNQRCLGLVADLEKNSTLVRTKMHIVLKDCNSVEIFRSPEGSNKSKDYREAYHGSIRQAFQVFESMTYTYQPPKETTTVSYANDIKNVQEDSDRQLVKEAAVVQVATPEEQSYKDMEPQPSDYKKGIEKNPAESKTLSSEEDQNIWTAKELENGYELSDDKSDIKVTLYKTSAPDVFLAKYGKVDGMVYKKNSKWFLEYYENSELIVKELRINF